MRITEEDVSDSYTIPTRAARLRHRRSTPRRRRSARRPRSWLVLTLIGLLLIGSGGIGALLATQHAGALQTATIIDLQRGADQLQLAKTAVVKANSGTGDLGQLNAALVDFQRARADFQRALDRIEADVLLRGARISPGIGASYVEPRVQTVEAIARMGIDLANAGEGSTQLDVALISPSQPGTKSGAKILSVMTLAQAKAPAIKADLQRAQDETAKVYPQFLPSSQRDSFTKAKGEIAKGLTEMGEFELLAPAVVDFLGGNGSRTYLVEQPDPAELRAGGGFIGTYSLLTTNKGDITLGKAGNTADIDYPRPKIGNPLYIPPPGPLLQFTSTQSYIFGDSNFLPDFPQAAQTGENLFMHETGTKVDGVVSLDPWAVAGLLGVTGPIAIPEWNTTVDAATFPESVFQQQQKTANTDPNRKAFFSAVAALLIARVMALPSGQWSQLLTVLNTQVTQRHLQIYTNNATVLAEISRVGWSGSMVVPTAADETMMEVESNFGADKANHWLARTYNLVLTSAGGKLHHALTVSYVNTTPPGYPGGQRYSCYVRFYYSAAATGGQISTAPDGIPNTESHTGYNLLDGWFGIDAFHPGSVRIAWDTAMNPTATERIYWQKQAGTLADPIKVSYEVNGSTHTATSDLGQDRVLVLSPNGVTILAGSAGQAHLPLLGSQS